MERLRYAPVCVEVNSESMMPSKIRLATKRTCALVNSTLVEVEYAWKPIWCRSCHFFGHCMSQCESHDFQSVVEVESPKDCDRDDFFRDRVAGDQQLASGLVGASLDQGSSCSYHVDSRPSPSRDLASSDGVDERLINPTPTISSIAHLSPVGQETRDNIALSPLTVEGSLGYDRSTSDASISFEYALKGGILSMEVDVSGAGGAQQLPFTNTDRLEVPSGSPCYGRNVGSLVSGFAVSTLEVCSETEHPNLPVMNCQPGLDNPYQAVTDDLQDGDPSACRSLGRLKRNLEEIRKWFNAYRARPKGDFAFPESRPISVLIFEDPSSIMGVTKIPSPLPIEGLSPSDDGEGPPSSLSKSKRHKKRRSPPAPTPV
ncbi:hypothetical protein Nepgr_021075 [Nepenthes gracilis]|uniref:Uncharacterized protein n=1 Tax=Nepenthes gracilis TaxID=150966 RepID=A0AAD3SYV9_NEPGR|nr:hypothetical protein Nepgr_021075 [Nepenthes gracilis]